MLEIKDSVKSKLGCFYESFQTREQTLHTTIFDDSLAKQGYFVAEDCHIFHLSKHLFDASHISQATVNREMF